MKNPISHSSLPLWRGTSFSGLAVAQSNAIYMNHGNVGMGGGMWLWIVISVLAVALLLVVINKLTKK